MWRFCFAAAPEGRDAAALDAELTTIVDAEMVSEVPSAADRAAAAGRIPVGGRVWARYDGDGEGYSGAVTKVVSRNRYMIQFDGYDGSELCSEVEEQPDPELERRRLLDASRRKLDHVRKHYAEKGGATLLHGAARNGRVALAKWLLARGANVMAKNTGGFTALHIASRHNQFQIVGLLLDKGGARLGRMRSELTRETAWDIAKWAGAEDVCKLIENRTSSQRIREQQEHSRRSRSQH